MKSDGFFGRGLIVFYTLVIFPWIYFDLSVSQIDLLGHLGYDLYAVSLTFAGFVPFVMIMIFSGMNRKISLEKRGLIRMTAAIQTVCLVFTVYVLIRISTELPFANIGVVQLDEKCLTEVLKVQNEISVNMYVRMPSNEGLRLYFNNEAPLARQEMETILSERDILFKK